MQRPPKAVNARGVLPFAEPATVVVQLKVAAGSSSHTSGARNQLAQAAMNNIV